MGQVYVYDAAALGNRKYNTSSLALPIRVGGPKVATGSEFGVTLRRSSVGTVEVVAFH
jgi:hypothetical protein